MKMFDWFVVKRNPISGVKCIPTRVQTTNIDLFSFVSFQQLDSVLISRHQRLPLQHSVRVRALLQHLVQRRPSVRWGKIAVWILPISTSQALFSLLSATPAQSSFGFGSTNTVSQAQSLGGGFGSMPSTQSTAFNFSTTTTPSFGFGGTATSAAPSLGFGLPAASSAAPAFGLSTNTTQSGTGLFGSTGFGGFGTSAAAPAFGQTNTGFGGELTEYV